MGLYQSGTVSIIDKLVQKNLGSFMLVDAKAVDGDGGTNVLNINTIPESAITHNNLGGKQGGTAGEYYHMTSAQNSALHDAVTVLDTASIDFTLTGQQITASVLPAGVSHNSLANLTTGDPHTQYLNTTRADLLYWKDTGTTTLTGNSTIAQGNYSATFNLTGTGDFVVQDNGTTRFMVDDTGRVLIGTGTAVSSVQALITPQATTYKGLVIRGLASQTGSLLEFQTSAGTANSYFRADGSFVYSLTGGANQAMAVTNTASTVQDGSAATGTSESMNNLWEAIKVTASFTGNTRSFGVRLKRTGTLTNTTAVIYGKLYTDVAGSPGVSLGGSFYVRYGNLTTTFAEYTFYTGTVALTTGTSYWLVLTQSQAPAGGTIEIDGTTTGTNTHAYSATGSSWTLESSKDCYYKLYGVANTAIGGASTNTYGVTGTSTNYIGVYGVSNNYFGVYGVSTNNVAIYGTSNYAAGIQGVSTAGTGVQGSSTSGYGGYFTSSSGMGVYASSSSSNGVAGVSTSGTALVGTSTTGLGTSITINPATTNTSAEIARYSRTTSGTAASNIAGYFSTFIENGSGTSKESSRDKVSLTTVTAGAEVSSRTWSILVAGTLTEKLFLLSTGLKVGAYTLPFTDGTANQVLATNGSGTVSWVTGGGGSMTYPGAGIAVSTGSAWDTSISTTYFEPALGNPGVTGYILSSTTGGVRSWVAQSGGISGLNTNGAVYAASATTVASTSAMTDGQLMIGKTGLAPVSASLTAGTGISITPGAGTITITNTATGGTPAGADGMSQYNNGGAFGASSLYYDDVNQEYRIDNVLAPGGARWILAGTTSAKTSFVNMECSTDGASPIFSLYKTDGTINTPVATSSGRTLGVYGFGGYGTTYGIGATISAATASTWTASNHETNLLFQTTGVGSITSAPALKLNSDKSMQVYGNISQFNNAAWLITAYGPTSSGSGQSVTLGGGAANTSGNGGDVNISGGMYAGGGNAGNVHIYTGGGGSNWLTRYSQAYFGGYFGEEFKGSGGRRHYYNSDTQTLDGYIHEFRRSRGTFDTPTATADTDILGIIQFSGYQGTSYQKGAQIKAVISGTPGSGDMPTDLVFLTSPDGSATPVQRVKINADGTVTVGTSTTTYTLPATRGTAGQVLMTDGSGNVTWTTLPIPGGYGS